MKTWFITGATGGLATAIISQLLERGDRVAATTRKKDALAALESEYGAQLWVTALDLTNPQAVNGAVNQAFQIFGTVDVLLNNAAYGLYGTVEGISTKQTGEVFSVNVFGSLNTARTFLPHFREQGGGQIIQIASMAGQYSAPVTGMYSASKWAVEAAFEALATEVEPFNIQTTIVEPGGIRTNFVGGNGVFGEDPIAYQDTKVEKMVRLMKGDVPGMDLATYEKYIAGDPEKMAHQIISRVDVGKGPLRLTLGSDAYQKIKASLEARLAALTEQKTVAYSTDADDYVAR
ncbi:Short chain oxidoreductase [Secundilactobacillus kimchicus JCM 15530]|uniref:Short chain oxidoreductase n=2 Tax=Secundilactobacillus kimchicus TaxID=528209 RepID=A0A0R1HVF7_9LACO|nr:SDR family NAD(P)-dependent oxidoreductase [Secundilactobacillus kimchicus]KRK47828.1 Short chain oxidoreductase [Secundilactobacillus kimchicus JCM 15530]